MGAQQLTANCTICGSSNVSQVLALSSLASIVRCKNCKNAFTFPQPVLPDYTQEDFHANGISENTKLTHFEDLPEEIQASYRIQKAMVEQCVSKNDRVLEIGGGEGIFLDLLRRHGQNVEMIEPSLTASTRARARGIKVHNTYFQKLPPDSAYSLVLMAHVLEHMQDPQAILEDVRKRLLPKGYLILTQTNFKGFMPRFLKKNWYAWVPDQHFSHFSVKGIAYLADRSHFEVITYKYSRLFHGKSIYHIILRYIPFLQDQIHVTLRLKE
jgi:2-polyprenyl-3-methyl-5-hydroxy-6-metoxy-1,4-benzoquinol methylase